MGTISPHVRQVEKRRLKWESISAAARKQVRKRCPIYIFTQNSIAIVACLARASVQPPKIHIILSVFAFRHFCLNMLFKKTLRLTSEIEFGVPRQFLWPHPGAKRASNTAEEDRRIFEEVEASEDSVPDTFTLVTLRPDR